MSLLSEIERIKAVMGDLSEGGKKSDFQIDRNLKKTLTTLKYLKAYGPAIEKMMTKISTISKTQIIDFDLVERGLRKVLLVKGDKQKNVSDYLGKIISSLKYRERTGYGTEPESEDYEFDDEVSLIPKKIYKKEIYELQVELIKLQEWIMKTGKTVIIVFEGRDSAGKGSTIKKFIEHLNPRYYNVIALGVPTPEEKKDWWGRYKKEIKRGMINLFDRSWYNRGLIEPVMGYGTTEEYEDFIENVEWFENELVKEGDYLFKLWFSIDKLTQKRRFDIRQTSPLKHWKYSPNDSKMQDLWDRFTEFKEKLFDKTSSINNPWVIIDAADKRISGLNSIRYVLQNIPYENKDEKVLDKSYPEVLTVLTPLQK